MVTCISFIIVIIFFFFFWLGVNPIIIKHHILKHHIPEIRNYVDQSHILTRFARLSRSAFISPFAPRALAREIQYSIVQYIYIYIYIYIYYYNILCYIITCYYQ